MTKNDPYAADPLKELSIVVPQTVYNWRIARGDAERGKRGFDRHEMAEVAAAAEVIGSMEYFLQIAEADALFEADLNKRGLTMYPGGDVIRAKEPVHPASKSPTPVSDIAKVNAVALIVGKLSADDVRKLAEYTGAAGWTELTAQLAYALDDGE